jgi:hypothetical protein
MWLEVMVMVRVLELVPTEFVAVIVTTNVPHAVGVPVILPVRGSRLRPGGSPVAV